MFFENKVLYGMKGEVPEATRASRSARRDIKREGEDVTIVAISRMVQPVAGRGEDAGRTKASRSRSSIRAPSRRWMRT